MDVGRPDTTEFAAYDRPYVGLVPGTDVMAALTVQLPETLALLDGLDDAWAGRHAYAPDKWTVKEVLGHVGDIERIYGYRILCLARGERAALPGSDQDSYVRAARFNERSLADLTQELQVIREGTLRLLGGLQPDAWARRGVANGQHVSVRGLAFVIAGHEAHHRRILRQRYLAPAGGE